MNANRRSRNSLQLIEESILPALSKMKDFDKANNVNPRLCAQCGGVCCLRCGCHFSPDDFEEISFDFLRNEIAKGYISIDCIRYDELFSSRNIYFLRIRNLDAPIVDTRERKRSPCILLAKDGCKLDYEHRPTGGKLLVPMVTLSALGKRKYACHSSYSIDICCYEWSFYQDILLQLIRYFVTQTIPCSI